MSSKPPSQPKPKDSSAEAVYGVGSAVASSRTQMQHKCVEMSLTITTALAAGVFAMMFHERPQNAAPVFNVDPSVFLVIVVDLYALLQLLILANYLFHTFLCTINWLAPHEYSQEHDEAIDASLTQKLQPRPSASEKARAAILRCFQPLIIYCSTFIGLAAGLGLAICLLWPVWSWPCWFFVLISIALLSVLYTMIGFHTDIERLAHCWFWVGVEEKDKSLVQFLPKGLKWLSFLWRKHEPPLSPKEGPGQISDAQS
jgi:hypothetical protein